MGQITPPQIYVSRSVIDESVREVLRDPQLETVWAEYGLVFPNGNVLMTGIIVPSPEDITRKEREAEIGGGIYVSGAQRWLEENWKLAQKVGVVKTQAKFINLHIGHSHRTLALREYSATDKKTILESIEKHGLDVAIGMLANIDENSVNINRSNPEPLFVSGKWKVRLRFYYLSRAMVEAGQKEPVIVVPKVVATKDVPVMPPLGWQTIHDTRFNTDLRQLKNWGCAVELKYVSKDNKYPYETRFIISNRERRWKGILYVHIPWNYPEKGELTYFIKPIVDRPGAVTNYPGKCLQDGPVVRKDENLIELIWRLEARGEL